MFNGLPQDILVEVLVRMPAKSLLKFRCVSKSWKYLIDSKEFIDLHLCGGGISARPNRFIFGICFPPKKARCRAGLGNSRYPVKPYEAEIDSPDKMKSTMVELRCPFETNLNDTARLWGDYIHGSCNGLICLTRNRSNVILWNPSINKHWTLPYCPSPRPICRRFRYGFGYDNIADDYKVVRLAQFETRSDHDIKVYSLKSNLWKTIPSSPPYFLFDYGVCAGKLTNYALHWVVHVNFERDRSVDLEQTQLQIVALDLRTEKYNLVPLPRDISAGRVWELGVFDGCLGVLCRALGGLWGDFWIMREYGLKDSWIKLTIATGLQNWPLFADPIAYSQNSNKLLVQTRLAVGGDTQKLLWHDTESQVAEKADIDGLLPGYCYVDSLVKPHSEATDHENESNKRERSSDSPLKSKQRRFD